MWFYNHVVWTDLCSSIVPLSEKTASEMALARKGKKGWRSPSSEMANQNLLGKRETLKQKAWDTMRIWRYPMLCKGKINVDVFEAELPGGKQEGAQRLVEKVRGSVNVRFQNEASKPNIMFTDRGRGFYNPGSGVITAEYQAALADNNFRAIMGDNAAEQPGSLQGLLLHETAVSWLRRQLSR